MLTLAEIASDASRAASAAKVKEGKLLDDEKGKDGLVKTKPPLVCSREQIGVSFIDTRKLDSLQYRKPLNSRGFAWRQSPPVQEQRQCPKLP